MFRYVAAFMALLAAAFVMYLVLSIGDAFYSTVKRVAGGPGLLDTALQVLAWGAFAYVIAYAAAVFIYKRRR